ncbi:MAG: nuclear transport factor 2 family protein [Alphaproteobacteria bacterium]|nr:nuclear transport factor 2 family protein [Alphaproteobacteria bacterium]MDE2042217.1 nuclear transport factor 2 family protein [Alphaproteobacteria bacterium]MDE2339549.1 nuclear transport factor 2 family protein [Alphaproteobacteria bacterium]
MRRYALTLLLAAAFGTSAEAKSCHLTPKVIATRFFHTFYDELQPRAAFMRWVAPDYIQHNPIAADGRDNAINALEPLFKSAPGMHYEIKRIIADGPLVAVHSFARFSPSDKGSAIVDIVRVQGCHIVEHWDVIQPMPDKSANPHPMF